MAEPDDDPNEESGLNDRLLDVFVFLPVGVALSVVEEIPRLAARGRERFGVRVSSARAVGQLAVKVGLRRSEALSRRFGAGAPSGRPSRKPSAATRPPAGAVPADRTAPARPAPFGDGRGGSVPPGRPATGGVNGHIPPVTALSIPGFDALSASQVVQRLDGLNRTELVSVRTYEASTRGRRTILNRVDQLLDERS
jgi:hypothetical protein